MASFNEKILTAAVNLTNHSKTINQLRENISGASVK